MGARSAACSCVPSCTHGKAGVGRPAQPVRRMRRTHAAHGPSLRYPSTHGQWVACAGLTAKSKRRQANGERRWLAAPAENGLRTADCTICGVPATPVDPRHAWLPRKRGTRIRTSTRHFPTIQPALAAGRNRVGSWSPGSSSRPPVNVSGVGRVARSGTVCGMDAALRAPMDGFTAGPGPGCPTHSRTRQQGANALRDQREPTRTKYKQPKKNPAEAGFFVEQHNQQRDQSPCCFCRCSQRSCASIVRSAVKRASRRSRPISSPVSTQKP